MGGLGHYLEEEGLATTQISLVREHTAIIKPPRALWVPFDLGRPLGAPDEPDFQRRVLLGALSLLEAPAGPVLEDYLQEAPSLDREPAPLACPVSFEAKKADLSPAGRLREAIVAEVAELRSWYDLGLEKRGRTSAMTSGLEIEAVVDFIAAFLDQPPVNPRPELSLAEVLKLAAEDLKAFYYEAATAQPGQGGLQPHKLADWFWSGTEAARLLKAVREATKGADDKQLSFIGKYTLVPEAQLEAGE